MRQSKRFWETYSLSRGPSISYPRESADVGRPSRRRPGVNSASLKVIYLWFMEERARYTRKPKVSRLLGDEAERIIGWAQWTGGDIVYTSNPTAVRSAKKTKRMSAAFLAFGRREKISRLLRARRIFRAMLETETPPSRRLQLRMQLDFFIFFFFFLQWEKFVMKNLIRRENGGVIRNRIFSLR